VIDQDNPYHVVTVRGKVVEQTNKGADAQIDKLAKNTLESINILYVRQLKKGLS
jgi:hypothetical protein